MKINSLMMLMILWAFAISAHAQNDVDVDSTAYQQRRFEQLVHAWQTTTTLAARQRLETETAAVERRLDIWSDNKYGPKVYDLIAGGSFAAKEIKFQPQPRSVELRVLKTFSVEGDEWLARRMTAGAVELWTPKEGWLFDGHGRELHHAVVPRRDGHGLEWYGAFLPDGRWVTTDLWEYDQTLEFFSAEGKFLKDIPSIHLHTPGKNDYFSEDRLVTWARSDARGQGWVVDIGPGIGSGVVWVAADGTTTRSLTGIEPWTSCYARQLAARGSFLNFEIPSDDGQRLFDVWCVNHGPNSGFTQYSVYDAGPAGRINPAALDRDQTPSLWRVGLDDISGNMGFWPELHRTFITVNQHDGEPAQRQTWFFDELGQMQGWLASTWHLGDAADGKAMLFKRADHAILTLSADLKLRDARRFAAAGQTVIPMQIWDDLHLGIFDTGHGLVLATWS